MDQLDQGEKLIDQLVERARSLTDEDLRNLAWARGGVDETFHIGAWRAAWEMVVERAEAYTNAWLRIGPAFIPERLRELVELGDRAESDQVNEWQDVARLAKLALDDELLALLTADLIPPPHLRQLHLAWRRMLEAAPGLPKT